jgi:hypothetical protein
LSHGGDKADQTPDFADHHGHEDTQYHDQPHHHPQVGHQDGEAAIEAMLLEPADRRVEHRRQEEGEYAPADEGAYLPQQKECDQHHYGG